MNPTKDTGRARHGARPSGGRPLSVLLLCDDSRGHASTLLEHIAAFRKYSAHRVRQFNPRALRRSRFLDLDDFDVVVIHYSLCIVIDEYLAPDFREKLRAFRGLKIQFVQDDYRWVDEIATMMRYIGIHVLFTLVPTSEIPKVWSEARLPGVIKISTLAGFVPEGLVGTGGRPIEGRPIDIGYRGRLLPFWVGRLGQEKVRIAQGVLARAEKYDLRCDIAWEEKDRIYGRPWFEFLGSCKATLGTESGASITDFDGSIERRVKRYLSENPRADFETVHREILRPYEGNVRMNVISPRVFEAIALQTPLILFPGEYSGVVQPWLHYIPLAKDFSNMDEVVGKIRDVPAMRAMADRAYVDVVGSGRYSYRRLIEQFDVVVDEMATSRAGTWKFRFMAARVEGAPVRAMSSLGPSVGSLLAKVLGNRWPLPLVRLLENPSSFIAKGFLACRIGSAVGPMREILRLYVRDREARRRVSWYRMMNDLLKLEVLRRALAGTLEANPPLRLAVSVDAGSGTITVTSRAGHLGETGTGPWGGTPATPKGEGRLNQTLRACLLSRQVRSVIWDHTEIGRPVTCSLPGRRQATVGLDPDGIHRFEGVGELLCLHPDEMADLLLTVFRGPAHGLHSSSGGSGYLATADTSQPDAAGDGGKP